MDRFEEALKQAMRRQEAPEGFAANVLRMAARPPARRGVWESLRGWLRIPVLRWSAAAAMALLLMFSVQHAAEQRRRAEGERARQQVLTAVRITAGKLDDARNKVLRATSRIGAGRDEPRQAGAVRPANVI